ncbi:MAG: hypothetical protein WBV31_20065 [Terriglobales bacterium]
MHSLMIDYPITKRLPCSVCGLDTFRRKGWYLVVENRWLDRLKILSWHSSLAVQKDMKSVCCRQHLKTLISHWLDQASLRLPPGYNPPLPISSDPTLTDVDLGPNGVGLLVGELAVHRQSFSRVWSGSPETLECILDALLTVGAENKPHALEFQLFGSPHSPHGLSLQ